jgi:hypothetical protein
MDDRHKAYSRAVRNAKIIHGIYDTAIDGEIIPAAMTPEPEPDYVSEEDRAAIDACVAAMTREAAELQVRIDRADVELREIIRNMRDRTGHRMPKELPESVMSKTDAMDWLVAAIVIVAPALLLVWAYYR